MGCPLFSNSHFQMGVTVMGFAEHFGHCILVLKKDIFVNNLSSWMKLLLSDAGKKEKIFRR